MMHIKIAPLNKEAPQGKSQHIPKIFNIVFELVVNNQNSLQQNEHLTARSKGIHDMELDMLEATKQH